MLIYKRRISPGRQGKCERRNPDDSWVDGFEYAEAGPQLLLQAFLQRIVNGGGRVEREYGLGRRRTDLLLLWPYKNGKQKAVIELKLLYGGLESTIEKGLEQTWAYMDQCGASFLCVIPTQLLKSFSSPVVHEKIKISYPGGKSNPFSIFDFLIFLTRPKEPKFFC